MKAIKTFPQDAKPGSCSFAFNLTVICIQNKNIQKLLRRDEICLSAFPIFMAVFHDVLRLMNNSLLFNFLLFVYLVIALIALMA